jgi:hypothetical protein
MAETMASPAPQKIVGTANPSFTSDFCNKIGESGQTRTDANDP